MKKLLGLIFFSIFFFSLVSAVPPVTTVQQNDNGLQIFYPEFPYVQQNADFTLHVHYTNVTDGLQIPSSQTDCYVHLYYANGTHSLQQAMTPASDGLEHELLITSGNFSEIGTHAFYIYCNSSTIGGTVKGVYEITPSGVELTEAKSILIIGSLAILILFMGLIFFGIGMLPERNTKDEEGKILSISYLKYLRSTLWFVEWILLIAILFISSNVASAYLGITLISGILFKLFYICFALTPLVVTVWMIWIIVSMFHDKQFQRLLNRGFFPQGNL